jgi:hypothetical protein
LEDQIEAMRLKEESKFKLSLDASTSAEMQQVKLLLQDMIITKDEIEKQTEELVRNLLEKDPEGMSTIMSISSSKESLQIGNGVVGKFKEGFLGKKIPEIMRNEIIEMKELSQVMREV